MLYFALFRIVFVFYNHSEIPSGNILETAQSFIYAMRLDLSTACILISFSFILWTLQQFIKNKIIQDINNIYNYLLIIVVSFLSIANIKIYKEWGTLLSARALKYLIYPRDALSFISLGSLIMLVAFFILFSLIGIRLYKKTAFRFSSIQLNGKRVLTNAVMIPILLLVGSRGGIQQSPINESTVCFSQVQILNSIATNNIWYIGHSIVEATAKSNPYTFFDYENAKKIKSELYKTTSDCSVSILKSPRPNIVFIVLESWTADIVKGLGGEENVTPHFDELCKDGLLFTQMYGSGFRTEQGLVSIFSGFPAQPNNSIITTPEKAAKLPSLTQKLAKLDYKLSFYYGGEIEFANMKSYLINSGFEKLIDKKDFSSNQLNSKWGAHDEYVFDKQLNGLQNEKQPFCSVVLTLSSHEPFEVPMSTPFNGRGESDQFKKAAYYTDYCLFKYFEKAKKQAWYSNTLFIIIADHGHRLPKNRDMNSPESKRITAFITGGALKDSLKGKTFNKICNQNDIAATILEQMKLSHSDFLWSKDVFNSKTKSFAYYSNENVLGWIAPDEKVIYSFGAKSFSRLDSKSQPSKKMDDTILNDAKAYLQTLYQQYLDY